MSPTALIIVADPGPDPDDIKALLIAAILHMQCHVSLRAVVCNGGGSARDRARLARCVLDHVGATDVPVGIGSDGVSVVAQPHEYAIAGYGTERDGSLRVGAELLLDVLTRAADKSISVCLISSLKDFADVCASRPGLVRRKVCVVAVQGGLVADPTAPAGWAPDTSQNNEFDREAAAAVYDFCFAHGVPMTVTSRHAVPVIPMQLARSFAERTACPVMRYLASAQFLGLKGLWARLCNGTLPARCTKQWYFETFCAVDAAAFARADYAALGTDADIVAHLDGVVKPYDVIALMTVLPQARGLFPREAVFIHKGVEHLLLLEPTHAISAEAVSNVLREVYSEVALATTARSVGLRSRRSTAQSGLRASFTSAAHGVRGSLLGMQSETRQRSAVVVGEGQPEGAAGVLSTALRTASADAASRTARTTPAASTSSASRALRVDLREVLRGELSVEPRRQCKVDEHGLAALIEASLVLALARRVWLVRGVSASALCVVALCLPLWLFGGAKVLEHTTAFAALGLLNAVWVVATITPATNVVARADAALVALISVVPVGGLLVLLVKSWPRLRSAPATFLVTEIESALPRALASEAALAIGVAISYLALPVLAYPILFVARASRALFGGRARGEASGRARDVVPPSLTPAAFKRNMIAWSACLAAWLALWNVWAFAVLANADARASTLAVHAAIACAMLGLAAFCASRQAQHAVYAAVSPCCRPAGYRGAVLSLAPLFGFGSAGALPDARTLATEAALAFRVVSLDAIARAMLCNGHTGSLKGGAAAGARAHAADKRARASSLPGERTRQKLICFFTEPALANHATLGGGGSVRSLQQEAGVALRASRAPRADAFVVRAPSDGPMAAELCAWAERFEARRGRAPTVWLRELCADPSLSAATHLAHLPCHLARCDRLLLLASPRTPLHFPAAIACYCWAALGGRPEDIDVALAANVPSAQTLAAFDAFHVMHADCEPRSGSASLDDEREACALAEQLRSCVRLATVRAFNWGVREVLPAMRAAAELRRAESAVGRDAPCEIIDRTASLGRRSSSETASTRARRSADEADASSHSRHERSANKGGIHWMKPCGEQGDDGEE